MTARVMSTRAKLLASGALLAAAAGAAGLGTFGSFTSTTSATEAVTAGTVAINLSAPASGNYITVAANNIVPGDVIKRVVNLNNTGDNVGGISLTTSASPSSVLDTDATNGLQLVIQKCSVAWSASYTCSSGASSVVASRAVIGNNIALTGLNAATAGGTDNLMVQLTLPTAAGDTFQGKSSTLTFAFTATQRAATTQ
jgi:hypothetical protein